MCRALLLLLFLCSMAAASEIPKDRVVRLHRAIDDELAKQAIAELLFHQMEDQKAPIVLSIDSPGGSVTATFAILDTMRFVKCPVWTECRGEAQGCAAVLFAAGATGHRRAGRDAVFSITRTVLGSSPHDGRTTLQYLAKMNERLISELATACKQQPSRIAKDMAAELSFTAEEAIEYGLADQVL